MKVTTDACLFGAWAASESARSGTALDIGTGTGLLSLMLAQQTQLVIDAIEIDTDACAQARENAESSPWKDRIRVRQGDALNTPANTTYDVIISNPPFYEKQLKSDDQRRNIAHHGESLTLGQLAAVIQQLLAPGGSFFTLLPYRRSSEIGRLLKRSALVAMKTVFVRQSPNHSYFRLMLKGCLAGEQPGPAEIGEISIWNAEQQYTDEFRALLKKYYIIF